MTVRSSSRAPPWADLPVELVDAVVDHLDLFSTARLAGVCTSWARAVASNASLPFGTPCLLMTTPKEDDIVEAHEDKDCTFQLLDHSRGKELSFPAFVEGMRGGRWWVGAKDDWLATVDEQYCNAELVNPYTGRRISLPPLTTIPEVQIEEDRTVVFEGGEYSFCRIVVCETPSGTDNGYLAVAMVSEAILAITRAGDASWTPLMTPFHPTMYSYVECTDVVLHKGKVFAVSWSGDIYTWDMGSDWFPYPEPDSIRPPHIVHHGYGCQWNLAESTDGRRLLLVAFPYHKSVQATVHLYEMDVDDIVNTVGADDGAGWSIVTSLGDHSLFLGANFPFLARVVVNDQKDDRELLRPNCVYQTDGMLSEASLGLECCFHVCDLEDNTCKPYREFYANHKGSYQTPTPSVF